jgi:hypothetical protein
MGGHPSNEIADAGADNDLLLAEPAVLTGAPVGYARVSTGSQRLDRQIKVLTDAECIRIFTDTKKIRQERRT